MGSIPLLAMLFSPRPKISTLNYNVALGNDFMALLTLFHSRGLGTKIFFIQGY